MTQETRPSGPTLTKPVPQPTKNVKKIEFPSLIPAGIEDVWRVTTDFDFVVYLMKPWFTITYDRAAKGHNLASEWEMETDWKLFGVIPYGRWGERIIEWNPPHQFADLITNSPYKYWKHTHLYESRGPNETLYTDSIEIDTGWYGPVGIWMLKLLWIPRRRKLIGYFKKRAARR